MQNNEELIWEKINTAGKRKIEAAYLKEIYSPNLSIELKNILAEKIGLLSKDGWRLIQFLIKQYGVQAELIHAAGICHQPEAKDWLLRVLKQHKEFNVETLEALRCWGGVISTKFLKKILSEPEQTKRIAGLELLKFKAYQLSDNELLELTKELLNDFRDPVVIATIKILQRRDSIEICNHIMQVAEKGSNATAHTALMALSGIGTKNSYEGLVKLSRELPIGKKRDLAQKQLEHQYRFKKGSPNKKFKK